MGENLVIETTSIAAIAWLQDQQRYAQYITPAVDWLVRQVKSGGRYGSTQATILSLKAITTYMQNFASINGQGDFVLRLNGTAVQTIVFTSDKKDAILFDFAKLLREQPQYFKPGRELKLSISLENFQVDPNESKDFKVNYAFTFNYYDTTPIATSTVIAYNVTQVFADKNLGATAQVGKVFSYKLRLENLKKGGPVPIPLAANATPADAAMPIVYDGGLGMVLAIVRVPACLQIDFNYLEALKRNRVVDFYEVRSFNSEIVLYWRQMRPAEVKNVQVDLVQRYSGSCLQKPHTAYPYYNNDQPIWVMAQAAKK